MRAGNHHRVTTAYEKLFYDFRHRAVAKTLVEHIFDFRIAARNRVADYDEIGMRLQMFGFVSLIDRYAERFELCRHRRIDVLIRSGNFITLCLEHSGKRSHSRAADAD